MHRGLLPLLPLFLLLLLAASLAADPYYVIDLDKSSLLLDSGEQKQLEISIRNPNSVSTTVTIALLGEINTWGTVEESQLTIPPETIKTTTLFVGAPKAAAAGTYGMTISATGEVAEESVSASKTFSVRIRRDESFLISLSKDYNTISPKETLTLTINLENMGNVLQDLTLLTQIDGQAIDTRQVDLGPLTTQALSIPFEIPNTISPGEKALTVSLLAENRVLEKEEQKLTINTVSKVTEDKFDEKRFWHREITHTYTNDGNTREAKDATIELSRLEQAFMTSSLSPSSKDGTKLTWNLALLPDETITISILTYGSVLYIAYLLILTIILLASYLTYTKVINKPPINLEKNVLGISRGETKNEVVVGLYLKNTSGKTFHNISLTDTVSSFFDVKKFESLSPDQVNEREKDIEYIWNFKEMKPYEERAIVYHMHGRGPIVMNPASIKFQAGNKTYFKKTGKVAVTG